MAKSNPLEEYKIASDNLRWYSNMRFAQLTLYLAVIAAISNAIISERISAVTIPSIVLKVGGFLASILFWYLEMRADEYWSHFMNRAETLEKILGFKQYANRPKRKLRTTYAIRSFITAIGIFWLASLFLNL